MNNYKHGNWYCKPANEAEAKEIVERAVASGAVLYEYVGSSDVEHQRPWKFCSAWGVLNGHTYTGDVEFPTSAFVFADAQELTIQQVRERFPLPNRVDCTNAPEDAQFCSFGHFRKHENGNEYIWCEGKWTPTDYEPISVHRTCPDFELRPEKISDDWGGMKYQCHEGGVVDTSYDPLEFNKNSPVFELRAYKTQSDIQYTHEYKLHTQTAVVRCVIVSSGRDKHGNIVVLNEFGFYKTVPQNEVHPIRTERDKWVEAALSDRPKHAHLLLGAFAESIYDAMKDGKLEKP